MCQLLPINKGISYGRASFQTQHVWENVMSSTASLGSSAIPASHILGRKLDSIPFSAHHLVIILVLGAVGFIEGYDLALGGSLIVLAKAPLQLTGSDIRWLAVGPTFMLCLGGVFFLAGIRPFEPQEHRADRRVPDDVSDLVNPTGANCRATDHPAPVGRPWRQRRRLGGVPYRRRIDAGAAPAHLQRCL